MAGFLIAKGMYIAMNDAISKHFLSAVYVGSPCRNGSVLPMVKSIVAMLASKRHSQNVRLVASQFEMDTKIKTANAIALMSAMKNRFPNVPFVGSLSIMVFVMLKVVFAPRNALTQFYRSVRFAENP